MGLYLVEPMVWDTHRIHRIHPIHRRGLYMFWHLGGPSPILTSFWIRVATLMRPWSISDQGCDPDPKKWSKSIRVATLSHKGTKSLRVARLGPNSNTDQNRLGQQP